MKKFKLGKSKSKSSSSEDDPTSLGLKKPGSGSGSTNKSPNRRPSSSDSTTSLDPKHSVDNLLDKWERNSGQNDNDHDDDDDVEDINNNEPKQEIYMGTRRLTLTNIEKIKGQMKELHMKDGKYIPTISEDGGDMKQPSSSGGKKTSSTTSEYQRPSTSSVSNNVLCNMLLQVRRGVARGVLLVGLQDLNKLARGSSRVGPVLATRRI